MPSDFFTLVVTCVIPNLAFFPFLRGLSLLPSMTFPDLTLFLSDPPFSLILPFMVVPYDEDQCGREVRHSSRKDPFRIQEVSLAIDLHVPPRFVASTFMEGRYNHLLPQVDSISYLKKMSKFRRLA